MKRLIPFAILLFTTGSAAQAASPYVDQHDRDIKALSQAEIEGYLDGKGMGQAMAAELNGYPGPKHVLELADKLELTASQRERTKVIFDRMHEEAVRLRERIVERERQLDLAFAAGDVEEQWLESTLADLGKLKGRFALHAPGGASRAASAADGRTGRGIPNASGLCGKRGSS